MRSWSGKIVIYIVIMFLFLALNASCSSNTTETNKNEGVFPTMKIKIPKYMEPGSLAQNVNYKSSSDRTDNPLGMPIETTPRFFKIKNDTYCIITQGGTVVSKFSKGKNFFNIFEGSNVFDADNAWILADNQRNSVKWVTGQGSIINSEEFNDDKYWSEGVPYWSRIYYGIMDIKTAKVKGKEYIFAVIHGENKNLISNGVKYVNSVMKKKDYSDEQYSGVFNGVWKDYSEAYFAFCSFAVMPVEDFVKGARIDDPKYDKGPIAWPVNGYLTPEGVKVPSPGMRHQSLFLDKEYIYVYVIDGSTPKVLRSPLSALGEPLSFKTVKDGEFCIPSLPAEFNKNDRSYLTKKPEESQPIFKSTGTFSFSVAKLKGTEYYLGVEEYSTKWPQAGVRLRISGDLINWSEPVVIPGAYVNDYDTGTLHYPKFCNSDFTSSDEIDPDDFYIVGMFGNNTGKGSSVNAVKMSIELN